MLAKNPKKQEKLTRDLCPQLLRFTFGVAARQKCGGCPSPDWWQWPVPGAASHAGKAAVGLMRFT